jgi:hypothetical protein
MDMCNIEESCEAVSVDVAATEFPTSLSEIIREGDFLPQQVFNTSETGLFCQINDVVLKTRRMYQVSRHRRTGVDQQ